MRERSFFGSSAVAVGDTDADDGSLEENDFCRFVCGTDAHRCVPKRADGSAAFLLN